MPPTYTRYIPVNATNPTLVIQSNPSASHESFLNIHTMQTRSKSKSHHDLTTTIFDLSLPPIIEPTNIHDAMKHSCWATAVKEELDVLINNHTWTLVPLPRGRHPINFKCLFKIKKKLDGSMDCFKAILVARGFSQKPSFDFQDTLSPVIKPQTM